MARTKVASGPNIRSLVTLFIYVSLVAVLITYLTPIVGVNLPAFGKKTFSVKDLVRVIPKGAPKKEERPSKLSVNYDFMDLVKEISPRDPNTKNVVKVSPEFVLGAMVPIALACVYLLALVGLFLAPIKNSLGLFVTSALSVLFASYSVAGTYYLGKATEKAFSDSVSKLSGTPFASITQNFVQQVSVRPEYGLYLILILTILTLTLSWYRNMKEFR